MTYASMNEMFADLATKGSGNKVSKNTLSKTMNLIWTDKGKRIVKSDLVTTMKILLNEFVSFHGYDRIEEDNSRSHLFDRDSFDNEDGGIRNKSMRNDNNDKDEETPDSKMYVIEEKNGRTVYKCKLCNETFYRKLISLKRHYRKYHSSGSAVFVCEFCQKIFMERRNLKNHIDRCHDKSKEYKCPQCPFVFHNKTYLKKHELIHSNASIICSTCGRGFKTKGQYNSHVKYAHDFSQTFVCEVCGKGFNHKVKLNLHVKNNHVHSTIECEICRKSIPKKYKIKHLRVVHPDVKPEIHFDCHICNKWFPAQLALDEHVKYSHLKTKDTQCHICFQYFTKLCIKSHIQKIHQRTKPRRPEPERKFECDLCHKFFVRKCVMERHKLLVHAGRRDFKCDQCGKAYQQQYDLTNHLKSHVREAKMMEQDLI